MVRKLRSQRLNGLFPLSYVGVVPVSPPNFIIDERAPTTNDSKNFYIGDLWLYHLPPTLELWMLADLQQNLATWIQLYPGGGGGGAGTFPCDVGVAIQVGGILNVLGTGADITTTGAGNTVTISAGSNIATSYVEDVGVAVPLANVLNIVGAAGIATAGAGNTVTISQGADVPLEFDADVGMAIPAFNVINIFGGVGCATSAAGNTVTIDLDANVAEQYTADVGVAVPVANNLNVFGGVGCSTTGAVDTITVDVDGTVATQYTTDAGVAIPAANNLNVLGGAGITTSGAGSTITITATGGGGGVQDGFLAFQPSSTGGVAGSAGQVPYNLGTNVALTELFDDGGNFFPGNGAGLPAVFTAPATGIYEFRMKASLSRTDRNGMIFIECSNGYGSFPLGSEASGALGITTWHVVYPLTIGDTVLFRVWAIGGLPNDTAVAGLNTIPGRLIVTCVSGFRIG